jgi:hypothetical protein
MVLAVDGIVCETEAMITTGRERFLWRWLRNAFLASVCAWLAIELVWAQTAGVITLKVQVNSKTNRDERSGENARQRTQVKSLEITLQNFSPVAHTNLTVNYFLFAEKLVTEKITPGRSGPISVAKSGVKNVLLPANGKVTVQSASAEFTYTPESKTAHNWTGGQVLLETKPGSGTRFVGHAVIVTDGKRVLASDVDPKSLANAFPALTQPPAGGLVFRPNGN